MPNLPDFSKMTDEEIVDLLELVQRSGIGLDQYLGNALGGWFLALELLERVSRLQIAAATKG